MVITETHFQTGRLPPNWFDEMQQGVVKRGVLVSKGTMILQIPLGENACESTHFQLRVRFFGTVRNMTCSDGVATIAVDLESGKNVVNLAGIAPLAETKTGKVPEEGFHTVEFHFEKENLRATVDAREVISARDPEFRASRMFTLGLWGNCEVEHIQISGEGKIEALPKLEKSGQKLELEVAVDFFDDLIYAPWTREMFERLFALFRNWGVSRCCWIHNGSWQEGWWDYAPFGVAQHARKTFENVGEFFPAAVAAAHKAGIEIYGLIKPFDMGVAQWNAPAEGTGRLMRLGGPENWLAKFAADRRDLIMARRPQEPGESPRVKIARIDIVKNDTQPVSFSVADVELYVSSDNRTYALYEGPLSREESIEGYPDWIHTPGGEKPSGVTKAARVMRLSNLSLSERFVAVRVPGGRSSFQNTLLNLVHLFDADGQRLDVTFGLTAREGDFEITENVSTISSPADFRQTGIRFDCRPGVPSSIFPGYDAIRSSWALDNEQGILGIAIGKNDGPLAALSPSFPEVRQWWLGYVKDCLEAGADGIELRIRNHHSPLAWGDYGFETPVRDEYLERYGIDIWITEDFDRKKWADLRGEAYTEFCRQVRSLTQEFERPLRLHLSLTNHLGPDCSSAMNIHWDWQRWLEEGLADSVTLKDVPPGSRFSDEIFRRITNKGIRTVYCPYGNDIWLRPGGEQVVKEWISLAQREGCHGFQFYECAAAIRGTAEGNLTVTQPALEEVFRRFFSARS
jgi:hypothetical protein